MDFTTVLLLIVAVLFMIIAYLRHDGSLVTGLKSGGQTFIKLIPIFVAVFIIVGLSEVLVPQELISRWMGEQSGWRGIVLASALGAVMPPSILSASRWRPRCTKPAPALARAWPSLPPGRC